MSSPRQAILSLVLCLGSSFLVTHPQSLRADEPVYQKRTVSSWLQDFAIGRFPDREKDAAAVKAIRAIGADALPVLTSRLSTAASDLDQTQDIHTVSAFEALGAEARPAIPTLIELLAPAHDAARISLSEPSAQLNDRKSLAAARALKAIGEDSVRPLIEALDAEPTNIRFGAAMALESFPKQAKAVVPALIKALEDKAPDVRWRAARSLGTLRALPEVSVPALAKKVREDQDASVRNYAIMALGKFGTKAQSSAPTIREATNHPSSATRDYARKALESIEPSAEEAKPEQP
jgi:HEAT repeat protein